MEQKQARVITAIANNLDGEGEEWGSVKQRLGQVGTVEAPFSEYWVRLRFDDGKAISMPISCVEFIEPNKTTWI